MDPGKEEQRPAAVLLLPDPLAKSPGRMGAEAIANIARVLVGAMEERRPDLEWRAEHDLNRIPEGAMCFQLGDAAIRAFDSAARLPPTYRVLREEGHEPRIRRCIIEGEPESEEFLAGHRRLTRDFDDLAAEGEAAIRSGEDHHAGWALKALDVVLAEMNLARVLFETDGNWREAIRTPRPEYTLPYGARIDVAPNYL